MLRAPRRLPQRYNRRIQRNTMSFVRKRHERRRQYAWQRWVRIFHRLQRRSEVLKKILLRFFSVIIAGLAMLLIGLFLFSSVFEVQEIRVQRTDQRIDIERVQHLLSPLFKRHLFFLSSQEVLPLLKNGLPESRDAPALPGIADIVSVEVNKRYPSSLLLTIKLDPLIARIKIIDPDTKGKPGGTGSSLQEYLTSQGVYVQYRPDQAGSSGTALPQLRIVDWGVRPSPSTPLLDSMFLRTMEHAEQALLEQFGQKIKERTFYVRAREFHLQTQEYALWFDLKSSLESQLLRYRIFLQTVGKGAAKEYIDVRLTDKVVYK